MKSLKIYLVIGILLNFWLGSCQQKKKEFSASQFKNTKNKSELLARTTSVFIDNAQKGEYATGITIESGSLKVGQQIDAVGKGKKYSFTVIEIKVKDTKVNQVSKAENVFVILQTFEKADQFDSGFTIVNYGATTIPKNNENDSKSDLTHTSEVSADFNSKKWSGVSFFNSNLLYFKGLSVMNCSKSYLMLGFQSNLLPDNRQLTFTVCGFEPKIGKIAVSTIEVSLSGAESGDTKLAVAAGSKGKGVTEPFLLEITKYEKTTTNEALISGKFSGTVGGALVKNSIKITNGVFVNVKVKVFNENF